MARCVKIFFSILIVNFSIIYIAFGADANKDGIDNILDIIDAPDQQQEALEQMDQASHAQKAEIIILNKITAKSVKYIFSLNQPKEIGTLSIELKACLKGADAFARNNAMAVLVREQHDKQPSRTIFYSWLFTHNPSISSFEHPVYEIIPLKCF